MEPLATQHVYPTPYLGRLQITPLQVVIRWMLYVGYRYTTVYYRTKKVAAENVS